MTLLKVPVAFNHPDWLFELKLDGFRALAHIEGHNCRLVSRNGHVFRQWPYLQIELAHSIRCESAILDGEIVCLDDDGRSNFRKVLFRHEWPYFFAFDLLKVDGRDLRNLPLLARKRQLKRIMPEVQSRLRYTEHIDGAGERFFQLACEEDLEGIVAKWKHGSYSDYPQRTSWLKIKNPTYSQARAGESCSRNATTASADTCGSGGSWCWRNAFAV